MTIYNRGKANSHIRLKVLSENEKSLSNNVTNRMYIISLWGYSHDDDSVTMAISS